MINYTILPKTIFVFVALVFANLAHSQSSRMELDSLSHSTIGLNKTLIYITGGTAIFSSHLSLSLERNIYASDDIFFTSFWLKGSIGRDYYTMDEGLHRTYQLAFTNISGTGKNHFELSLGGSYCFDKSNYEYFIKLHDKEPEKYRIPEKSDHEHYYFAFALGYRYQKPGGVIMFRTGVGYPETLYVGIGLAL